MRHPAYLVASRQGLYVVRRGGWRRVAEGLYFGLACAGGEVFAFRHGHEGDAAAPGSGRIVRLEWADGLLHERHVVVEGLHPNGHQLEHFEGRFFLVDTAHQRVLEFGPGWNPAARHQLLPDVDPEGPEHAHLNSITVTAEAVYVMLHNHRRGLASEIWELDPSFSRRRSIGLPSSGCHDIALLPDGRMLTCLSPLGAVGEVPGERHPVDAFWTRGLVATEEEIVVGSSLYGRRLGRALLPGFVTFLDRRYRRTARHYLPAAPTQIRGLDFDPG